MTTPFRTLGGVGPDPFAPKKRTLPSSDILRVLSWDPNNSMDHGRLRAIHHRLNSVRCVDGPTQEQSLLEWTLTNRGVSSSRHTRIRRHASRTPNVSAAPSPGRP